MRAIRLLAALGLLLGSFAYATPVAAGDPCYHGFDLPPLTEGTDPQVKLLPCAFAPTVLRVAPGTTVEWYSGPYDVHLITGAGQQWGSRDDEIQPDSMVSYKFLRAGTYPYACALHRGMSGVVVVGDGTVASAKAGSGPAVVTVVGPAGKKAAASAAPAAAAPAAVAPAVRSAAPAPVAPAAQDAASSEPSAVAPVATVAALIVLALIVATIAAVRFTAARRAHRGVPIEG